MLNTKMLIKDIKGDLSKWRDLPRSWFGRLNIVNISVLLKVIYESNIMSAQIPARAL